MLALQPQDLALTILGSHVRRPGQAVWSGGMVRLLRDFGFSSEASRAALARLAARGLVARAKQGRLVYYTLTPAAQRLLADGDRRIFEFGRRRDGERERWTIVWHAIPESRRIERARLAAGLRFLGFGSVQDATWLARGDREAEVAQLLRGIDALEHAFVFVARDSSATDVRWLVETAWDLQLVTRRYEAFLAEFEPLLETPQGSIDDADGFRARTRLMHFFRAFPSSDPELPDDLAPIGELRARAVRAFDRLYHDLGPVAERHFQLAADARERTAVTE